MMWIRAFFWVVEGESVVCFVLEEEEVDAWVCLESRGGGDSRATDCGL
jgi:hypothetical protein